MPQKIKYSIPFNGDLGLMNEFLRTGRVYEIYCMGAEDLDYSYQCHQPRCSKRTIEGLFKLTKKYKVGINLLINSPILSYRDTEELRRYISDLEKKWGSFRITLSDPYQISIFKKEFPDLLIEASVIMNLDSPAKIERILKMGVDVVNVPLCLNREMKKLKNIAKLKKYYPDFKIKLMVNHVCYFGCPFTSHHYFFSELERVFGLVMKGIDLDQCASFSMDKKELIKRPFIRPEDVAYYLKNKVGDIFKILWRHSRSEVLRRTVSAYLENNYSGNLFDIIETHQEKLSFYCDNHAFPGDFVRKVTHCDKAECRDCGYCEGVGMKTLRKMPFDKEMHFDKRKKDNKSLPLLEL
ncbi:MAG: U32 family peptidase [Spirochaetes bacterium]|nr:U32 family peptidase [Spirochaetota bacterium]